MSGVNLDRFAYGKRDSQDYCCLPRCEECGHEITGGQFFTDICDDCAVREGWLTREESA
jgi:hypothetical protein